MCTVLKGSAQDAHEAIRPISLELTPKMVEPFLSRDELKIIYVNLESFYGEPNGTTTK